ncbi:MAG: hypothetical protein AB8U25_02185 [Rickettsiales endosymbiont of Dermacentor nuttalli]
MDEKESFVNLNIPVINIIDNRDNKSYVIYTSEQDYVIDEALEKQNITSPYKIIMPNDKNKFIIDNNKKQ